MIPSPRLLCLMAAGIFLQPMNAATVVLQQGAQPTSGYTGTLDAFVTNGTTFNASTTRNYGGAGALGISADPLVYSSNTQGQFLSLIQFDTGVAKSQFDIQFGDGGWTVSDVSLKLNVQSPANSIFNANHAGNIDIRWLTKDLTAADEGTGTPGSSSTSGITFSNLFSYISVGDESAGTFNFAGGNSGTFSASLILTSGLLSDILNGSNAGLELLPSAGSQVSAVFASRNFGTAANRPSLSITAVAVPEPGRIMLLVLGSFAVLLRRSKPSSSP